MRYEAIPSEEPGAAVAIRRASLADEPAVLALVPRLVAFGPPPWRDPASMSATDLSVIAQTLRLDAADPVVLVATAVNEELAGFVHLRSLTDYYTRRQHGHVADLVVAEGHEGRGVATRLLAAGEEWARDQGYEWLTISVFDENARAAKLYEHLGYRRDIARLLKPLR